MDLGSARGLANEIREGEEDGQQVIDDEFETGYGCSTGIWAGVGWNFGGGKNEFVFLQVRGARSEWGGGARGEETGGRRVVAGRIAEGERGILER